MTEPEITAVPGGYPNGRAALDGLVRIAEREAAVRDALQRAEYMVTSLKTSLSALELERRDALSAVDLFADIAPASLGCTSDGPGNDAEIVERSLTAIELEVRALLAQRGERS